MVATVGRAVTLLERDALDLASVGSVVLDEVDVMVLDESFPLQTIGSAAPSESVQFVFVSATLPPGVADQLRLEFPGLKLVSGPGLHRVSPRAAVELIDCSAVEREAEKQRETEEAVRLAAERIGAGAERGSGKTIVLKFHRWFELLINNY